MTLAALPGQGQGRADRVDPVMPAALDLARFDAARFIEDRATLLAALAAARGDGGAKAAPGPDAVAALLDLAELSLAHGMVPEGRSFLAGLPDELSPEMTDRRDALALGLWALGHEATPPGDAAARLLGPDAAGWPDQPLFLAEAAIRSGDLAGAAPYLPGALARLGGLSKPVEALLLPGLLEAAVVAADWGLARSFAQRFADHPGMTDGSAYHFLLGRTAESGGDLVAAFDSYATASRGADLWAHRARLALIDLGRETGTLPLEDARILLEQSLALWRGGDEALAVLQRLAIVETTLGDDVAALETLASIQQRHPETSAAASARQQSRGLIESLYERGLSGEMPLAGFLEAHRRVALNFAFQPGLSELAERLADHLLQAGASGAAAREYGAVHDTLAAARDLELAEVAEGDLDRLRLKQAEALLRGGQYAEATTILAQGLEGDDAAARDRLNLLRALLFSATEAPIAVLETAMQAPSEAYLRIRAEAHFAQGDWAEAQRAYDGLWQQLGQALPPADAINLLLSAHRGGDSATTLKLSQAFPDLAQSPYWAEIAEALAQAAPEMFPLRESTARQRVGTAEDALRRLEALALQQAGTTDPQSVPEK